MAASEKITKGSKVSYEDMANPLRHGVVTAVQPSTVKVGGTTIPCMPFVIEWEDGTVTTSDCRQAGWKVEVA